MNKMQRNAQETDPDKQTYGPAMREKVLALAARFDAVRGKGEELKAAIEPLAVEEARAKDAEERAAREAEEAAQLRQQEEARKAEEARAAAEAAAAAAEAEAHRAKKEEEQRRIAEIQAAKAKAEQETAIAAAVKIAQEEAAAAEARAAAEAEKEKKREESRAKKEALRERTAVKPQPNPAQLASMLSGVTAAAPVAPKTWGSVRHVVGGAVELRSLLEEAKAAGALTVVDWSMTTCGPCQRIKPIYEQMARTRPTALFVGVDTHASPLNAALAREAAVSAFPTFHFYVDMQRKADLVGADTARLAMMVQQHDPIDATKLPSEGEGEPNPATKAEMQAAILKALGELKESTASMDDFVTSVQTLLTFVGNVLAHPGEDKYRSVKMNNNTFNQRLGRHNGGVAAMEAFGFKRVAGAEPMLVISKAAAKHDGLPAMKVLLERAVPARPAAVPSASSVAPPLVNPFAALGGMGGMPPMNPQMMQQMMDTFASNPQALSQMAEMVRNNPGLIQQAAASNPQMAQMFQANPHMQQMMEQMASNPAALSAALNNPFARSMMGAGVEGMGAGTAAAAPLPPEFAPRGMSEDEMLAEAIRRSKSEDGGGAPAEIPAKSAFCGTCGTPFQGAQKFCGECGQKRLTPVPLFSTSDGEYDEASPLTCSSRPRT